MTARLVLWTLIGPGVFLAAVVGFSTVAALSGVPPQQIGTVVAGQGSEVLFAASLGLGLLALFLPLTEIWGDQRPLAADIAMGVAGGGVLAAAYLLWLAPGLTWMQAHFGDYVPAGAVGSTLTGNLLLFGLANVLLAPMVEETLYRGFLLPRLVARMGLTGGVIASCLGFGLLHWLGGVWYMALTGLVAGSMFAGLRLWRGSMVAPFAAHLTLNMLEFAASAAC